MKREQSVRTKIFIPLVVAMLAQVILIVGGIYAKGTISELNHNEFRILSQQVINRVDYLQDAMQKWSNLDGAVYDINRIAERCYADYGGDFTGLEKNEAVYRELLEDAAPVLISLLRGNSVNGVFLVLDTQAPEAPLANKPGIYLRDLDSLSAPPEDNSDLLAKRLLPEMGRTLNIAYDADWKPSFRFGEQEELYAFYRRPYEEAWKRESWRSMDLGYWSAGFSLTGDTRQAIAYSVPLRLEDGTIYGVMGVDITLDHLKKLLGYQELNEEDLGAYILAAQRGDVLEVQMVNGPSLAYAMGDNRLLTLEQDGRSDKIPEAYCIRPGGKAVFYGSVIPLRIYDNYSPFEEDAWVLCGVIEGAEIFSFSEQISKMLEWTALVCIFMGVLIVIFVTVIISKPLVGMAQNVRGSDPRFPVVLPVTGVKELNELGEAIGQLSADVFDASNKFTQILKLASVEMAGFEVDEETGKLFVMEGFFTMFGQEEIPYEKLNGALFREKMGEVERRLRKRTGQESLYEIPREGETAWIRLNIIHQNHKWCGLAENVTKEIQEIQKVEYERDYDVLTNLLNRRAFRVRVEELLREGGRTLGIGAMLMIDLDNLKLLNDTYGHDWGDRYLKLTAAAMQKTATANCLISRMSGDEFLVFFYGYQDLAQIREALKRLEERMGQEYLTLPDGTAYRLRMSGGVAWYPRDAEDFQTLLKYADFAMYKIKNSVKGKFADFERESYLKESYLLQNKEELNKLIEQQLVEYHFQPIVDVRTGEIFAYEALMRSTLPTIPSIKEILTLARQEFKLGQIERLTWFLSVRSFVELRNKQAVDEKCKLFINSIPNQSLSDEDCRQFAALYQDVLSLIVVEVTEEEKMNAEIQFHKHEIIRSWGGQVAIDDYGTGYNGQSVLLRTSPEYVKIDQGFVRNVHLDDKKQAMIRSTLEYAGIRNIKVIAEGVETLEEVTCLLKLGVDYLQGYYYAKPAACPAKIDILKKQELVTLSAGMHKSGII